MTQTRIPQDLRMIWHQSMGLGIDQQSRSKITCSRQRHILLTQRLQAGIDLRRLSRRHAASRFGQIAFGRLRV